MWCFATWVSGGLGSSEFTQLYLMLLKVFTTPMTLWFHDSGGEVRMCFICTERSVLGNRKCSQNILSVCQVIAALRLDWVLHLET